MATSDDCRVASLRGDYLPFTFPFTNAWWPNRGRQPRTIPLQASQQYLDPFNDLDRTGVSLVVRPDDATSWDPFFTDRTGWSNLLLQPGDYSHWGRLEVRQAASAEHRRTIRHIDPGHRPWNAVPRQARVEGVTFKPGAHHWVVQGLTFRLGEKMQSLALAEPAAENITFDTIDVRGAIGHGVELQGPNGRLQRSVIEGATGAGVMVKAVNGPNLGARIVDNEIIDCADGILTDTAGSEAFFPGCGDLVIHGNDVYVTERHRCQGDRGTYSDLENGIDLKAGADEDQPPLLISSNRLWGFRRTERERDPDNPEESGGIGSAVTIHRGARRIVLFGNVIFNCPTGIQEVGWLCGNDRYEPFEGPRGVLVEYNLLHGIQKFHLDDLGAVLRNKQQFWVLDNDISRSLKLSELPDTDDVFAANRLFGTALGAAAGEWRSGANMIRTAAHTRDVAVERTRWTRSLPDAALPNAHIQPVLAPPGWRRTRTKPRDGRVQGPERLPDAMPDRCRSPPTDNEPPTGDED